MCDFILRLLSFRAWYWVKFVSSNIWCHSLRWPISLLWSHLPSHCTTCSMGRSRSANVLYFHRLANCHCSCLPLYSQWRASVLWCRSRMPWKNHITSLDVPVYWIRLWSRLFFCMQSLDSLAMFDTMISWKAASRWICRKECCKYSHHQTIGTFRSAYHTDTSSYKHFPSVLHKWLKFWSPSPFCLHSRCNSTCHVTFYGVNYNREFQKKITTSLRSYSELDSFWSWAEWRQPYQN